MTAGVRLFAALELPGSVRTALASWGARVSAREPAVRLVSSESLHVTLVFLGPQPPADVQDISGVVVGAARPVGELAVGGAAWLPPRRPGVLVVDLEESGHRLGELQQDLTAALAPWHEPDQRPFRPHVTVARVRRGERIASRGVPEPPRLVFAPRALVLYRSRVGTGGAQYEPLARVAL